MKNKNAVDRLSALLAALTILPGFFVAGIVYIKLFQITSMSGVFMAALIAAGICFAPAVFAIRGVLRLLHLVLVHFTDRDTPMR